MTHKVARIAASTILTILLAVVLMFAVTASAATTSAVINFEGLTEGQIISSVSVGSGISGGAISGSIAVNGINPRVAGNAAMIFDATCTPTATGGDDDLCAASLGNVLIVSEDLDSNDPDDSDSASATLTLDYSGFGPGTVTVESIDVIDVEQVEDQGVIRLYSGGPGGALLATFPIPVTGDNQVATIVMNTAGVDYMEVFLNGSGAIDNVKITVETDETPTPTPTTPAPTPTPTTPPPGGGEGCTPGYWKQSQHFDSWVGYTPTDSFEAVFGVNATGSPTLLDALKWGGGGEAALARHAVAALLNSASGGVSYAFSTADVITMVQNAYATGTFETTKNLLAAQNESGCPLD